MADVRIRRQIALIAARLMYERQESEYFTAKHKAARQLGVEYRFRPRDLPSNREIRDQIQALANLHEGDKRAENLRAMRLEALRMMRLQQSDDFDDLLLLRELDQSGRRRGAEVCNVTEALAYMKSLADDADSG